MSQHMEALQRANKIRYARADLKRAIRRGDVDVPDLLRGELPSFLGNMPVEELLLAIPNMGVAAVSRHATRVPCSTLRPLGKLTVRQRQQLAADLEAREGQAHDSLGRVA